jgi:hypothetical protein
MSRPPSPTPTQLRLDLAQKASEAPLAADPAAVIRTLADLMLQVLHPVAGNPAGGGDEPEAHR